MGETQLGLNQRYVLMEMSHDMLQRDLQQMEQLCGKLMQRLVESKTPAPAPAPAPVRAPAPAPVAAAPEEDDDNGTESVEHAGMINYRARTWTCCNRPMASQSCGRRVT